MFDNTFSPQILGCDIDTLCFDRLIASNEEKKKQKKHALCVELNTIITIMVLLSVRLMWFVVCKQ